MNRNWGHFTVDGGETGEAAVREAVQNVTETLAATLSPREYRSVVLIGGYGRGEGGIEQVDGELVPHNNLDLLVISRPGVSVQRLRDKSDQALEPLRRTYPFGIDIGGVEERHLRRAPCLVMWYDMRYGHKTLLGDADFVPSLERFELHRIEPSDVRNLLVNRGTLLVINDLILERHGLTEMERRTVIRHGMKAIIGYGDALLFFAGGYHWSYQTKRERMQACTAATPQFRTLYDRATDFRFQPRYDRYLDMDLRAWNEDLAAHFEPIHLACEARRLRAPNLSWPHYVGAACRHALVEEAGRPRAWARKLRACIRSHSESPEGDWAMRLGSRCLDMRGWLSLMFPFVAYRKAAPSGREAVTQLLDAPSKEEPALRRAYLHTWAVHGDPNFKTLLHKLGRDITEHVEA